MIVSKIRKVFRWMVVLFFSSTILVVIAYRFLPVYITPLMVIRCFQQVNRGESVTLHHHWVSLDKISPHMPVAVMASEDQRFLKHHGFDFGAIKNAALHDMDGGRVHGGSTISQQTAKNVFLWPGRSWIRKGFETYFTFLIELLWGKHRIMEVYLNSIEMGDGIYGADAVAEYHFNKKAVNLFRDECALIAATLPNPIKFNSAHPSEYVKKRQFQIEHEMRFIPAFPREGEDVNPRSMVGGYTPR
ncbi:MAG: monofunctional biosynthetic peptidoglycan transglycosylase [Prevotella sp.]|nr:MULTISPECIES: monofunctional biosynthetic peptidoglycan transglycosylase [unclassified Prevotella]MCH3991743.1 monofunctional biosynthetic peptidoglycan transglycosylase [Prevotella sp.]MCH4017699.1 monofunctional biosynthetic peptidoglycan transglycosylase [Prevotella sp.]MCH4185927.1 monofunctional biosynthetic peptidoglycan transglycosylase [Prevotella sp.]MCH4215833.1 monofunctional biosynthetic peptidoglycan transglycosylase [Prevotella sp.]MCI1291133.1 monofunctional biosynthetic pept